MARRGGAAGAIWAAAAIWAGGAARAQPLPPAPAGLLILNASRLQYAASLVLTRSALVAAPWAALLDDANELLGRPLVSVADKLAPPPSGDVRSYSSWAAYYWPCNYNSSGVFFPPTNALLPVWPVPGTARCNLSSGLPWVPHDGYASNDLLGLHDDSERVSDLVRGVTKLAYAWYLSGNQTFALRAGAMLRHFFLSPATGMLPHMDYAQAIPGVTPGRGVGIIDSRLLGTTLLDAATLLALAPSAWSVADAAGLRGWFANYTRWLVASPNGRDEAAATNNHGVWYDAQLHAAGLWVGNASLVSAVRRRLGPQRIAQSVDATGHMPQEEARTRSLHYVAFTLQPLVWHARLGGVGPGPVNLWNLTSSVGGRSSLAGALGVAAASAVGGAPWPFVNVDGETWCTSPLYATLLAAGAAGNATYAGWAAALGATCGSAAAAAVDTLLWAAPPSGWTAAAYSGTPSPSASPAPTTTPRTLARNLWLLVADTGGVNASCAQWLQEVYPHGAPAGPPGPALPGSQTESSLDGMAASVAADGSAALVPAWDAPAGTAWPGSSPPAPGSVPKLALVVARNGSATVGASMLSGQGALRGVAAAAGSSGGGGGLYLCTSSGVYLSPAPGGRAGSFVAVAGSGSCRGLALAPGGGALFASTSSGNGGVARVGGGGGGVRGPPPTTPNSSSLAAMLLAPWANAPALLATPASLAFGDDGSLFVADSDGGLQRYTSADGGVAWAMDARGPRLATGPTAAGGGGVLTATGLRSLAVTRDLDTDAQLVYATTTVSSALGGSAWLVCYDVAGDVWAFLVPAAPGTDLRAVLRVPAPATSSSSATPSATLSATPSATPSATGASSRTGAPSSPATGTPTASGSAAVTGSATAASTSTGSSSGTGASSASGTGASSASGTAASTSTGSSSGTATRSCAPSVTSSQAPPSRTASLRASPNRPVGSNASKTRTRTRTRTKTGSVTRSRSASRKRKALVR